MHSHKVAVLTKDERIHPKQFELALSFGGNRATDVRGFIFPYSISVKRVRLLGNIKIFEINDITVMSHPKTNRANVFDKLK